MSEHRVVADNGIPLRIVDGVPRCPMDGIPMTEVEPGVWQCSWWAETQEYLRKGLRAMLDPDNAET
jgi:hypothetical protein